MKKLVLATVIFLLWPDFARPDHLRDANRRQRYLSLQQPTLSDSSYVINDSLRIQLPDLTIHLLRGQLVPLQDNANGLTGLLFDGKAHVRFSPRHAVERQQLHYFTKDSTLAHEVSGLLLRFAKIPPEVPPTNFSPFFNDGQNLRKRWLRAPTKIRLGTAELPDLVQREWQQRRGLNLAAHLFNSKYADTSSQFILSAFVPVQPASEFPPLYLYLFNTQAYEVIQFFQYHKKALRQPLNLLCSYPLGDYFAAPPPDSVRLTKYNGWVETNSNGLLTADMGVDIFTGGRNVPSLFFTLAPDLLVSRVTDENGDTLDFIQGHNENGVTIFLPPAPVDTLRLLFHYAGKILVRNVSGGLYLKDAVFWVPHLNYLRRATYKIIFKCPRDFRVMAVGDLLREWEEGEYRLSYYSETTPAKAASFCLGKFTTDALTLAGLPPLEIHSTSLRNPQQRRHVASDIANSLFFFNRLIAPYQAAKLRVVEAPGFISHGYPGLVTLSWIGFQAHDGGILQALRSHEVAHQWFGNAVGWATYHDQWLSEALAEYLGALYVEWLIPDHKNFANLIQSWRDDLLEGGHIGVSLGLKRFGFAKNMLRHSEGLAAGPLWLGARLGQKDDLDYYLATYRKGAFIVHSLRWLLRDLTTGSDEKFWAFLADFVNQHRGGDPTTLDLQKVAEKHYGAPLDWFFKQWVYGMAIPTYRWSQQVESTTAGHLVKISIQQENVSLDFRMPVPVTVEYDDGVKIIQRVGVDQTGGQLTFLPRPARVKKVVFNTGNAVLCRVK